MSTIVIERKFICEQCGYIEILENDVVEYLQCPACTSKTGALQFKRKNYKGVERK